MMFIIRMWSSPPNIAPAGSGKSIPPPQRLVPLNYVSRLSGRGHRSRNAVIKFALERVPTSLGKSIATLPKIQRQIGEIDLALQAAQALLFEVSGEWRGDLESSKKVYPRVAAAKYQVTEAAALATDQALRVAGGTSITKDLPLERHFRDVRAGSMQPPSGGYCFGDDRAAGH